MRRQDFLLLLFSVIPVGCAGFSSRTLGPFSTLEEARQGVRAIQREGLTEPLVVKVKGDSTLSQPLVFDAADSGTPKAPIIYAAEGDGIISGGRRLTDWYRVGGGPLWRAHVGALKFRQLFINGKRMKPARTPNEGFFRVNGSADFQDPVRFRFREGQMSERWIGAEVVLLQTWGESRLPITAVDPSTQTVTLANHLLPWMIEPNARYWVENSADFLDQTGEWFLDHNSGIVYYYAAPDEDVREESVIVPTTSTLLVLSGTQNVSFTGFTFEYADWQLLSEGYADLQSAFDVPAAVTGSGVSGVAITRSHFAHLGTWAVNFDNGSENNTISQNEMRDLGAGGVKLGETCTDSVSAATPGLEVCNSDIAVSRGNKVTGNVIHDIGHVYIAAAGIWLGQTYGNKVCSNEVFDTNNSGISVGWTWGSGWTAAHDNLVAFNRIHNIGRGMLSDMGGIYTLGVQPGTTIRNNLIHDVTPSIYGGWGIYQDEGSGSILTEDNIVYRAHSGAFYHHAGGSENVVVNNIFASTEVAPIIHMDDTPDRQSVHFERNIFYGTGLFSDFAAPEPYFIFDGNLYFKPRFPQTVNDPRAILADPLFLAPQLGDFSLNSNSPAYRMGFHRIQLSSADKTCD